MFFPEQPESTVRTPEGELSRHDLLARAGGRGAPATEGDGWYATGDVTATELTASVAELLAAHKRPRVVHLADALPRDAMGNVRKKALR